MNQQERLLQFIAKMNISRAEFERRSGLANGYVKKLKGYLGENKLKGVLDAFPMLNKVWLLTGEGDMLNNNATSKDIVSPQTTSNEHIIKYYPYVEGSCGGLQFLDDPNEVCWDIVIPGFSDCKFAINVHGDSMLPLIKSGQIILMVEWLERFIEWGHIYLVVTKTGFRAVKRLFPGDTNETLKCVSENKEHFPAFEVAREDIHKLFLVKGWVCRNEI